MGKGDASERSIGGNVLMSRGYAEGAMVSEIPVASVDEMCPIHVRSCRCRVVEEGMKRSQQGKGLGGARKRGGEAAARVQ